MDTPATLTRAWDLLFSGRFRDSLVAFSLAAHDLRWAAEAQYGRGVAHLGLDEDVHAEAALWDSLQRAPLNPDAVFYLGLIAERRGRRQEAIGRYRDALAMAADHAGARTRLAAVQAGGRVRPSVVPLPAARPPAPPALARPVRREPARPAAEPDELERLLQAVRVSVRPRALAYLAGLDREVLAPLPVHPATAAVLAAFWAALFLPRSSLPFLAPLFTLLQVAVGVGAVLQLLGLALTALRARRTRITIEGGRVRVEGDPARPGVALELREVELLELRRTGLHPLTGDGTLVLGTPDATVLLCGVARGPQLTHLYRQLLELVDHLRDR